MLSIVARFFIIALSLLFAAAFIPGIVVANFYIALIVAVLLSVLNLTVKPVLYILTLPITILTLGLFAFVLNALLFWFVSTFVQGFVVDGVIAALLGALVVSVAAWAAEQIT